MSFILKIHHLIFFTAATTLTNVNYSYYDDTSYYISYDLVYDLKTHLVIETFKTLKLGMLSISAGNIDGRRAEIKSVIIYL